MTMALQLDPLREQDVRPAARLHRLAFPEFFLSSLGEPFLWQFYRGFLDDPTAVTVVAHDEAGTLRSVAVGTTEPGGFFGRLLRRRWPGFALASAHAVTRNPATALRLLRAVRYRGDVPSGGRAALLSSICVDPSAQGQGIGGLVLKDWVRQAAARGASTAVLTTDSGGANPANAFYREQGWKADAEFLTREGRPMLWYRLELGVR